MPISYTNVSDLGATQLLTSRDSGQECGPRQCAKLAAGIAKMTGFHLTNALFDILFSPHEWLSGNLLGT